MSSLMKKVVGGLVGVLLLGMMVFGDDLWSYVSTAHSNVSQAVNDQVPVSFQIDRARKMIDGLTPEIKKNQEAIYGERGEIKGLTERLAKMQETLADSERKIKFLRDDLATGSESTTFVYAGKSYERGVVEEDLTLRFDRYVKMEKAVEHLTAIRDKRSKSVKIAEQKLRAMKAQQGQLELEVEQLEARLEMIALAKTTSEYNFDESKLGDVKSLVAALKTKLDVQEQMLGENSELSNEISLEEIPPEVNITQQVTQHFEGPFNNAIVLE